MGADELVGRDASLAVLSDAIATIGDHGAALLLLGEPGIGKTACLLAAAALARDAGHQILQTAGHDAETLLPFAGLHRLLRPLLELADGLPGIQRQALFGAFGLDDGPPADPFVASVATVGLLRLASERRPLLLTADDVQWLDEQTRQVLGFVARRLDHPLVLIATARSIPAVPNLPDAVREIRLERLSETASARLLSRHAPSLTPAQKAWVINNAVGNPLALTELAFSVAPIDATELGRIAPRIPLTPSLERAFGSRWSDLPKPSRDAVLVAAVAADPSLAEILAATSQLSGRTVTSGVLERAQELDLLRFDDEHVYFTHPLVKAAVIQNESTTRRQAAHRALGNVITLNSARRAWHRALGAAAYDDAIAAELEATATENIRRGEGAGALSALERAAELTTHPAERGRRLLLAAKHAARLGETDVVVRLLDAAAGGELSEFDRVRAELFRENFGGIVITNTNRVTQLCSTARRAITAGEIDLALDLADAAARRRCAAPVDSAALGQLAALARQLATDSADARAIAVLALTDPVGNGRAVLSILDKVDQTVVIDGDQLSAYGVAARAVGHYGLASTLLDRAEAPLRARRMLGQLARNLCVLADLRLELGEWDRAESALAEFAPLSTAAMSPSHRATALATTAKIAALRGDSSKALGLVSEIEHSPAARSGSRYLARAQIVRGIACISSDRPLEAYVALGRVFEPADPSHHHREQFDALTYLAEAAARCGRHEQAREVVERIQLPADASGSPALAVHLSYARAVLAPDDSAEHMFLAALTSDSTRWPWPRARVQLAYGGWLRRQQRITQSRRSLKDALSTLEHLGATPWANRARNELDAAGAYSERSESGPAPNLLSVQETKIARLASQGMSNREIGEQLNLSPRTVSSHLYRIFPKLGVSARSQIASRMEQTQAHQRVRAAW